MICYSIAIVAYSNERNVEKWNPTKIMIIDFSIFFGGITTYNRKKKRDMEASIEKKYG